MHIIHFLKNAIVMGSHLRKITYWHHLAIEFICLCRTHWHPHILGL